MREKSTKNVLFFSWENKQQIQYLILLGLTKTNYIYILVDGIKKHL